MHSKESIETFMREFEFKPSSTQPEIRELPTLLSPEEKLHGLLEGILKKIHKRDINGRGLVILTNKRIIFFRKSFLGTVTKEEIPIGKVSSASFRKGLLFSSVAIITSSNDAEVEQCDKKIGQRFSDAIQRLISNLEPDRESSKAIDPVGTGNKISPLEQLEKLFTLKEKGVLTEEEFAAQKAKLLRM